MKLRAGTMVCGEMFVKQVVVSALQTQKRNEPTSPHIFEVELYGPDNVQKIPGFAQERFCTHCTVVEWPLTFEQRPLFDMLRTQSAHANETGILRETCGESGLPPAYPELTLTVQGEDWVYGVEVDVEQSVD